MPWIIIGVLFIVVAVGILVWRWFIRNQPYRRPWRVQFAYWFTPYAWLRWAGLVLVSILLIVFLLGLLGYGWLQANQFGLTSYTSTLLSSIGQDTFANVMAALAGAVIGALIAGVVSVSLQTQEFSSQSILRKKVQIYEPLYTALRDLRDQIGEKYPKYYSTDRRMTGTGMTQYVVWAEIKGESSYLHVPSWLKVALDDHLQEIADNNRIKSQATRLMNQKVHEVTMRERNRPFDTSGNNNLSDDMFESLIKAKPENATNYFRRGDQPDLTGEEYRNLFVRASDECLSILEVQAFKKHHENIVAHTEWLLDELKTLIEFINRRYEAQGDLF